MPEGEVVLMMFKRFLNIGTRKERGVHQEDRALSQRTDRFVEGSRRHIGSGRHRRNRAMRIEVIMGTMGFIAKNGHMVFVGEFHDIFKRTNRAKIGRVDHENRFGGRVARIALRQSSSEGWLAISKIVIDLWHDVNWDRAGKDETVDDRLMDVARKQNLLTRFDGGKNHCDDAA
jgi:hypothetical protein